MGVSVELPYLALERVIGVALDEDIGAGDRTSEACIDPQATPGLRALTHSVRASDVGLDFQP